MADVGVFTKNADIKAVAGTNANSTSVSTTETDKYVLWAESYVNVATMFNWSDWYVGTPNADVKYILTQCSACLCAMQVISNDMSGFTSRQEAQTMLDFLRDRVSMCIDILRQEVHRKFMQAA